MRIVVCIKQVPETTEVAIDPKTNSLVREGVASIINPFDTYAIEEAVRVKEAHGGEVIALSMGPPQAKKALQEAIAVGVDKGILISDPRFAGSDTLATSYILAQALKKLGEFKMIFCGKQASDGDTAQVGPGIAQRLKIPFITYVRKIEKIDADTLRVERLVEEGYEVLETHLPCLITVVKEINEPRLPSFRGMLKAKKAEIQVWNAEELNAEIGKVGFEGSPTRVIEIFTPPRRKKGIILKGEISEQVDKVVGEIIGMNIIKG
jgi:electron transfer flavoprotein beta subunit